MVVDDARDVVAVAEVALEEAQDAFGGLAGADEDDGLIEDVRFLEEDAQEVAHDEYGEDDEDAEEARVDARERDAFLEQEQQDDTAYNTVNDGAEDAPDRVQHGLHLRVGVGLCEEDEEDERHPEVGVLGRYGVDDVPVTAPEGQFFRPDDGQVVGQQEHHGREIARIFLGQTSPSYRWFLPLNLRSRNALPFFSQSCGSRKETFCSL